MSSTNNLFYSRPYHYSNRVAMVEEDEYERIMGDFEGEGSCAFGGEMEFEGTPSTYAAHSVNGYGSDFDLGEPMFDYSSSNADSLYPGDYEFDASPRNRFVSSPPNLVEYPSLLRSPESVGLRTPNSRDEEERIRYRSPRPLREEVLENEYRRNALRALPMSRRGSTSSHSQHSHHSGVSRHPGARSRRMSSSSIQSSPSLSSADSIVSSLPRTPPPPTSLTLQQQQPLHRMNKEQLLYEEFLLLKNQGMIYENQSFDEWLRLIRNDEGEIPSSSTRSEVKSVDERRLADWEQRVSRGRGFV